MRLRFPLYGKVLFWFLVNLGLVAALCLGFVLMQFRLSLDWVLEGPPGKRLEALGEVLTGELHERKAEEWNAVVARYQAASPGVTLALFRNDGRQVAGESLQLPQSVMEKIREHRAKPQGPEKPRPPPREGPGKPAPRNRSDRDPPPKPSQSPPPDNDPRGDRPAPPPRRARFMLRTSNPTFYWAGIHLGLTQPEASDSRAITMVVRAASLTGGGLFFDPLPLLGLCVGALALSALVWLPVVGGITRAIRRLNAAAHDISQGHFEVRVPERRRDELGELAGSVNSMASQLGHYVDRQRRLTADVAHELCSPIARMQRALGIVEQRGTPEQAGYIERLDQELQHMARLVEEVLAFSKAASLPEREAPEQIMLQDLICEAATREASDATVEISIPDGLRLRTLREALDRALGNILGNAVRYAGQAGPIEIKVREDNEFIDISIRDHGPGVPSEALGKIFEPFYRPEAARARNTGGAGLGLAIVRRCVEACGGEVSASLAEPSGLCVTIRLPKNI